MNKQLRAFVALVGTLLVSTAYVQSLFTNPHGEGLRGLAPATRTATPTIRWQKTLPLGVAHGAVFSNNGEFLYIKTLGAAQGQVFKIRASDGETVWSTNPAVVAFGNFSYAAVTVDEQAGRVYTTARASSSSHGQSFVCALDINDGHVIWLKTATEIGTGGDFGRGIVLLSPDRTRVYTRNNGNPDRIVALNAATGDVLWTFTSPYGGTVFQTLGPVWTDPGTGKTRIALSHNVDIDGAVAVIQDDGASASVVWDADPALGLSYRWWGNVVSSLDGSVLYANSFRDAGNPVLTAFDTDTGDILWQIFSDANNGMNQYPNPCVGADGTIYSGGRGFVVLTMFGAAAVGSPGDQWNGLGANNHTPRPWTLNNLKDANGNPTGINIEVRDFGDSETTGPRTGDPLMRDNFHLGANGYNGPGEILLSNVPAGTYNLYLYTFRAERTDEYAVFTVNGVTKTVTSPTGVFTGYVENENYVKYENISPDGNGNLSIRVDIDLFLTKAVVNGLQLEQTSGGTKLVNVDFSQPRAEGGALTAVNPDGTIKWQIGTPFSGELSGWPTVTAGGVIYATGQDTFDYTFLYAFKDNGPDATLLWTFRLPYVYFGTASPSVGPDGTVYIAATRDNADSQTLYALAPEAVPEREVTVNLPDYAASDPCVGPVHVEYTICAGSTTRLTGSFDIPAGQSSGSFTYAPDPGDTRICIKASHWTSKKSPIPAGTGPYTVDAGANGDINGDDFVDPSDFVLYQAAEFSFCGDPNYDPLADLNGDGFVDPSDFDIYVANEFAFGDGCGCP